MKIRQGFVSNSSSSSFCIIGVEMKEAPMDMLKKILDITDEEIFAKMAEKDTTSTVEDFCEGWLEDVLDEKEIDVHHMEDSGEKIIGNYVGSWEYESSSYSAQDALDKAKHVVGQLGIPAEDLRIFLGTTYG